MNYRNRSILIADGSKTVIMYSSIVIRRMGFEVIAAQNGEDALKLVKIQNPDLAILDVNLPCMDGIGVLKEIRKDGGLAHAAVVMISLDHSPEIRSACRDHGCDGYLTKPIKISELHRTLEQCLKKSGAASRRYIRTHFDKEVVVSYSGESERHYAVTLSEGGMLVRCRKPFPVGTMVDVRIPIPGEEQIMSKGEVIYNKEVSYGEPAKISPGMAIRFNEMSEKNRRKLQSYVPEVLAGDILREQGKSVLAKG